MKNYYDFVENFEWSGVAVDRAHAAMVYGLITSIKPNSILELGIGSGFITQTILHAIRYNGVGKLTSVDNWHDWKGHEPPHIMRLRELGANIIAPINEDLFVMNNQDKRYDFIFVDGNHREGGHWAQDIYNILENGGTLFSHDVCMDRYPTLKEYEKIAIRNNDYYRIFDKNSRDDEMCNRGLIMICKNVDK